MRYLLFTSKSYYARGGALDFNQGSDNLDYLLEIAATQVAFQLNDPDSWWFNILDTETRLIVAAFHGHVGGSLNESQDLLSPDCRIFVEPEVGRKVMAEITGQTRDVFLKRLTLL